MALPRALEPHNPLPAPVLPPLAAIPPPRHDAHLRHMPDPTARRAGHRARSAGEVPRGAERGGWDARAELGGRVY